MTIALTSSVFARPVFYSDTDAVVVATGTDPGGDLALSNVIKYRRMERGLETGGADGNGYDINMANSFGCVCWQVSNVASNEAVQNYYVQVDLDADSPYAASDYAGAMRAQPNGVPAATIPNYDLPTNTNIDGLWNDVNHIVGVDPKVSGSIAQTGLQTVTTKGARVTFRGGARSGGHESACVVFGTSGFNLKDRQGDPVGCLDISPRSNRLVRLPGRRWLWETTCTWRVPSSEAHELERWARARLDEGGMAFVFPVPQLRVSAASGVAYDRAKAAGPAMRGGLVQIREIGVQTVPKSVDDSDVTLTVRQWDEHTAE